MCLDLQRQFTRIPDVLSQKSLPNSFRYYDALISIVKARMRDQDTVNFESNVNVIVEQQARLDAENIVAPLTIGLRANPHVNTI